MKGIIYKWTNRENNKCYIGKTNNEQRRIKEHLYDRRYNSAFHNALDKYGADVFDYEVLFSCSTDNIERFNVILNTMERFFIRKYKADNKLYGYNLTSGGDGASGAVRSEEFKKNLSEKRLGANNPMYGKKWSENQREQLTKCKIGHKPYNNKAIVQLTLDGDFVAEWESALKAATELFTYNTRSNITKACREGRVCKGFLWKYLKDYAEDKLQK